MEKLIGAHAGDVQIITPDDGYHYFFGYYDMRATNADGKHLAHRVRFMDRLPTPTDVAELGTLKNGVFTPFATTTAWNFQQGAMLQWHPRREDTVYYNVCEGGRFMTVTHDLATGEKTYTDRATACVSPCGKWGLAINFGRIYAFRPGYGYAGFTDEGADVAAPTQDGVFLTDMETGRSRLLISYEKLAPLAGFLPTDKILVNHITFNPASDRFLALVRRFDDGDATRPWGKCSVPMICDLNGNAHPACPPTYFSHYYWVSNTDLVAHCTVEAEKKSLYRINTDSGEWQEYVLPDGHRDIHCILSPDGRYIIGDGYPKKEYRPLMAYSMQTGETRELFAAFSVTPPVTDIRCDLHVRFIDGGRAISFDTTHNGRRQIAVIPTNVLDF